MEKERLEELRKALDCLKEACQTGDLDTVKRLVGHRHEIAEFSYVTLPKRGIIDMSRLDLYETSPLEEAIFHDQLEIVRYFMEHGVQLPKKFYVKTTMSKEMALLLIDHGAPISPDAVNALGDTYLHLAAGQGALGCVEALVERGMDLHIRNKYQQTPLHKAILYDQAKVVEYLLESGASVHETDHMGNTPLHYAMGSKSHYVTKLLDYGARPDLLKMNRFGALPIHNHADRSKPFHHLMETCEPQSERPLFPISIHLHPARPEALTALRNGGIAKWKIAPGQAPELIQYIQTEHIYINDLAISPDGAWVALVAPDLKGVEIRRYEDLKLVKTLDFPNMSYWFRHVEYSPDGNWLCASDKVYDLQADRWLGFSGDDHSKAIAISPDSSLLAVAEYDQGWDTLDFIPLNPANDDEWDSFYPTQEHPHFPHRYYESTIHDVCFLPDSKRFVYYERFENCEDADKLGQLTMGLAHEEKELWRITLESPIRSYAGRKIICTEKEIICATDGTLVFLDPENGNVKKKVVVDPFFIILDLALAPDQQRLWVVVNNQVKEVVLS